MKIIGGERKGGALILRNIAAVAATAVAVACFAVRLAPQAMAQKETAALAAAGFIMPDGAAQILRTGFDSEHETEEQQETGEAPGVLSEPETSRQPDSKASSSGQAPSSSAPAASGAGQKIEELQIGNAGVQYQNVYVRNSNKNHSIDIKAELQKQPAVKIKTDGSPQVLIYHTHTTEAFLTKELSAYPKDGQTRSRDNSRNVVMVGNAIEAQLRAAGIGVVHDLTVHDYPAYNGSYNRSAQTIAKNLQKYPGIQVTLDIHRDAMTTSAGVRLKPTVKVNGKKAAQIMILSGCDDDGTLGFPNWEYNLRLAVRFQKSLSDLFPGLARPLNFGPTKYNGNLTKGSLLVEVGTEVNTLDEAIYSGELLGKAIVKSLLALK